MELSQILHIFVIINNDMRYTFNNTIFNKIDTEEKAYWLGFLYADGNVSSKRNRITIQINAKDKELIYKFLNFLNSDYKPSFPGDHIRLEINSKDIKLDLIKLGCVPCKSKILKFPNISQLHIEYYNHFIRGYFDGDGCIWNGKRKTMFLKNNKTRIIHNVKFNLTGTIDMIENIHNILISENIINKTKLNYSKKINNCIQLEQSGRVKINNIYRYLYNKATIFLTRKKEKFETILNFCANIE